MVAPYNKYLQSEIIKYVTCLVCRGRKKSTHSCNYSNKQKRHMTNNPNVCQHLNRQNTTSRWKQYLLLESCFDSWERKRVLAHLLKNKFVSLRLTSKANLSRVFYKKVVLSIRFSMQAMTERSEEKFMASIISFVTQLKENRPYRLMYFVTEPKVSYSKECRDANETPSVGSQAYHIEKISKVGIHRTYFYSITSDAVEACFKSMARRAAILLDCRIRAH